MFRPGGTGEQLFSFREFIETEAIRSLPWLPRHGCHGLVEPGQVGPHSTASRAETGAFARNQGWKWLEVAGKTEGYTDITRISQTQIRQSKSICSLDMLGLFAQIGGLLVPSYRPVSFEMDARSFHALKV